MLMILRIGVSAVGFVLICSALAAQTGTHDGFEVVKQEGNILVSERWVTFPQSSPPVIAREVKSEFYINTSIHRALALLRDESKRSDWQKHVSEFQTYPDSDSSWYEYSYHDIPWPVSDQDHFLEYTVEDPAESDGVFITFRTTENDEFAPLRKNVSRMTLSGSWYFQRVSDGRTKVTYRILSMPGPLPRLVTDPIIRSNLMSTVKNFIDLLERKDNR